MPKSVIYELVHRVYVTSNSEDEDEDNEKDEENDEEENVETESQEITVNWIVFYLLGCRQ